MTNTRRSSTACRRATPWSASWPGAATGPAAAAPRTAAWRRAPPAATARPAGAAGRGAGAGCAPSGHSRGTAVAASAMRRVHPAPATTHPPGPPPHPPCPSLPGSGYAAPARAAATRTRPSTYPTASRRGARTAWSLAPPRSGARPRPLRAPPRRGPRRRRRRRARPAPAPAQSHRWTMRRRRRCKRWLPCWACQAPAGRRWRRHWAPTAWRMRWSRWRWSRLPRRLPAQKQRRRQSSWPRRRSSPQPRPGRRRRQRPRRRAAAAQLAARAAAWWAGRCACSTARGTGCAVLATSTPAAPTGAGSRDAWSWRRAGALRQRRPPEPVPPAHSARCRWRAGPRCWQTAAFACYAPRPPASDACLQPWMRWCRAQEVDAGGVRRAALRVLAPAL